MRSFRIVLATAAATLLSSSTEISAFSTTSLGRGAASSTLLRAEEATELETTSPDLDYKTQWKVNDDSFTTTESGLMYQDSITGSGESPDEDGSIEIHYSFWFDQFENADDSTGTKYFSSRNERNPENIPIGFQYNKDAKILKGWLEGMKTMKQGGTRILIIPPELGYGDVEFPEAPGYPAIPPNSYLRFEVEMVKVDNSAWTKFRRMVPKPSSILDV